MKIFKLLPLLLCFSVVFANENDADNQRISIYLHPVTLIATSATKELPLFLYLTGEFPLSASNSLIVNPVMWTGGIVDGLFRIGTGVGVRHFPSGNASGFYLQGMVSGSYLSVDGGSGVFFDALGYLGYSAKFSGMSIFFDFGVGYGAGSAKSTGGNEFANVSPGLAADLNIGIGIPF